jgi:hypothetical protein
MSMSRVKSLSTDGVSAQCLQEALALVAIHDQCLLCSTRSSAFDHRTIHAQATKSTCMGTRTQSGVGGRPRRRTPRRAALTLAGSISSSNTINANEAQNLVAGINSPTAPASSATPVNSTNRSGRGNHGGTMAMRSFRMGAKCDTAVNTNIVARAARADDSYVPEEIQSCQAQATKCRQRAEKNKQYRHTSSMVLMRGVHPHPATENVNLRLRRWAIGPPGQASAEARNPRIAAAPK